MRFREHACKGKEATAGWNVERLVKTNQAGALGNELRRNTLGARLYQDISAQLKPAPADLGMTGTPIDFLDLLQPLFVPAFCHCVFFATWRRIIVLEYDSLRRKARFG